jgi:hypothetical protein
MDNPYAAHNECIKFKNFIAEGSNTQELWNIFIEISNMIKFSDTKAALLLTVHGVLLTIICKSIDSIYYYSSENCFTILLTILTAVTTIVSICYSSSVIYPRLTKPNPTSIVYFGSIQAFKDYPSYFQKVKNTFSDIEKFNEDISEQIYKTSCIAWKKFSRFEKSMRFFFVSMIFLLINIGYYTLLFKKYCS